MFRVQTISILSVFLIPGLASADPIEVSLDAKAFKGQKRPALVVTINEPISSVAVQLTRGDGKTYRNSTGPKTGGSTQRFELDAPIGDTRYVGALSVKFINGSTAEMALDFSVHVMDSFVIRWSEDRLDLDNQQLEIALNQEAGRCEYEVTIDGKLPRVGLARFGGEPAGTWLPIQWDKYADDDVVLRIRLTCWDRSGHFHSETRDLLPWRIEIPHADVIFETGKSVILEPEKPKLDGAIDDIREAVRRYGQVAKVNLYVVGHTDTVGDSGSNQRLSRERARAIAQYFRRAGVAVPIYYTGVGEAMLAVATADETDEARNRRAVYIVDNEHPEMYRWKRL